MLIAQTYGVYPKKLKAAESVRIPSSAALEATRSPRCLVSAGLVPPWLWLPCPKVAFPLCTCTPSVSSSSYKDAGPTPLGTAPIGCSAYVGQTGDRSYAPTAVGRHSGSPALPVGRESLEDEDSE